MREGPQPGNRPRLHVLAVGVNTYRDGRLQLNFADADAKALGEALRGRRRAVRDRRCHDVLDEDVTPPNLDKVFTELARKVRRQDVFVFFLAGHGKTMDGRYYFIPQDFRYDGKDSIVTLGIGQDQCRSGSRASRRARACCSSTPARAAR